MSDPRPGEAGKPVEEVPEDAVPVLPERPVWAHQPWMMGLVLVVAFITILAGLFDPVWFLIGAPCILVLVVYAAVKIISRFS